MRDVLGLIKKLTWQEEIDIEIARRKKINLGNCKKGNHNFEPYHDGNFKCMYCNYITKLND